MLSLSISTSQPCFYCLSVEIFASVKDYSGAIKNDRRKLSYPVTVFSIPAENLWFHDFPAVLSMSGGVVTWGCTNATQISGMLDMNHCTDSIFVELIAAWVSVAFHSRSRKAFAEIPFVFGKPHQTVNTSRSEKSRRNSARAKYASLAEMTRYFPPGIYWKQ